MVWLAKWMGHGTGRGNPMFSRRKLVGTGVSTRCWLSGIRQVRGHERPDKHSTWSYRLTLINAHKRNNTPTHLPFPSAPVSHKTIDPPPSEPPPSVPDAMSRAPIKHSGTAAKVSNPTHTTSGKGEPDGLEWAEGMYSTGSQQASLCASVNNRHLDTKRSGEG